MENSSKIIIIITILILSITIFYQVGVLAKTIISENQRIKDYNLFLIEQENQLSEARISYGEYKVTYNSTSKKADDVTVLYLYENTTFNLTVDVCGDILEYKGLYIINDDTITLMNVNNECNKYKNCNLKEFLISIENKTKLKLDLNIGCLGKNSIFDFVPSTLQ